MNGKDATNGLMLAVVGGALALGTFFSGFKFGASTQRATDIAICEAAIQARKKDSTEEASE